MKTLLLLAVLSQEAGPPIAPPQQPDSAATTPTPVRTEPEPSSGLGLWISGVSLMGFGAVSLAISPVCVSNFYRSSFGELGSRVCLYTSLIMGGVTLLTGIPLLIVGLMRRSEHRAWEERQPVTFNVFFDGRLAYAAVRFEL